VKSPALAVGLFWISVLIQLYQADGQDMKISFLAYIYRELKFLETALLWSLAAVPNFCWLFPN
jgi:hypothetical protein